MTGPFADAQMWLAAAVVWALALLILFRQPPAFGRWLSACEFAAPWWVTAILFACAAFAGKVLAFHIDQLLAATAQEAPAEPTTGAFLHWLFHFAWHGLTGPLRARAHLQAVLVLGALLFIFTALLYRQRYSIFAMDIVARRDAEAPPRRVVVMGLSMDLAPDAAERAVMQFSEHAAALDLDAAARADFKRFPWQQNLRVLRHHLLRPLPARGWLKRTWGRLARRPLPEPCRVVVVVPSPQSVLYAEAFLAAARACAANSGVSGVRFTVWPRAVDYNDLAALRRELLAVVRTQQEDKTVAARLDEISLDTTPGMKLVSIAGAAVTFASPLEFTYVEPQAPNGVVAFDVRAAFRLPIER